MKKTINMPTVILFVAIFVTNLTQTPQMLEFGFNSYINLACWGVMLAYILTNKSLRIEKTKLLAVAYFALFAFIVLMLEAFTDGVYFQTTMTYPYMLSLFVFMVGSLYCSIYEKIDISKLYISYIISGIIVALSVFLYSFSIGFDWDSRSYAYESKNSVSQIILTVVLLLIFAKVCKKIPKLVRFSAILLLIVLMAMLKSRASLIGVAVIVVYIVFSKNVSKRIRIVTALTAIVFCILVMVNAELKYIVVDSVLLAGRETGNLNDISSGRVDMFEDFFDNFGKYWLIGRGSYYLESFPLSLLMQYGVLGAIPVVLYLILPFRIIKKMKNKENKVVVISILICYYLNGLFEELAPLGPGVKCYFLWFLLGLEKVTNGVSEYESIDKCNSPGL